MENHYDLHQSSGSPHHFLANSPVAGPAYPSSGLNRINSPTNLPVLGTITLVLEGRFAIYLYQGSIEGEPQHGMFTFGYNTTLDQYEASWVDSFPQQHRHHVLHGLRHRERFQVLGSYPDPTGGPTGAGAPKWNWSIMIT